MTDIGQGCGCSTCKLADTQALGALRAEMPNGQMKENLWAIHQVWRTSDPLAALANAVNENCSSQGMALWEEWPCQSGMQQRLVQCTSYLRTAWPISEHLTFQLHVGAEQHIIMILPKVDSRPCLVVTTRWSCKTAPVAASRPFRIPLYYLLFIIWASYPASSARKQIRLCS